MFVSTYLEEVIAGEKVHLLNTGFVEVNFHRQRPRLLALLRLFHRHGNHGTQMVRVDFVSVVQKLFIPVDTQLDEERRTHTVFVPEDLGSHPDLLTSVV